MPVREMLLFRASTHKPTDPTPQPTSRTLYLSFTGTPAAKNTLSVEAWNPTFGCSSFTLPRSRVVSMTSFTTWLQFAIFENVTGIVIFFIHHHKPAIWGQTGLQT